ncbi:MAG: hypothetical protein CFH32_01421 [Alphaproteobacteria bacterium MarineAlpha9_Bin2]|nr:MAG: hypothetical protein CFH32_01421 [Alphaproteobacteria bacterium MarineAlpha9_Bin2]
MHISISNERLLEEAESLFKTGSFLEAVSKISDVRNIEAKIFCARTLAIYGHFLMQGDEAIEIFLKARKYAEEAVVLDPKNDKAHVEMAHTMGRYSQSVGIISALKEGFSERIAAHLDDAIKLNPNNINAQISKGTWHAEIVDKAPLIAGLIYSAYSKEARKHYNNALSLGSERIGELYEISYGLVLLGKNKDKLLATKLLLKAKQLDVKENLDSLYLKKVDELLSEL